MGKIFCVMGKSSSGKDTIYNKLILDKELQLSTITGYTTRPMRIGEQNGREYYFVTEEGLRHLENQGKVIEKRSYNTVYGEWFYATVDDGHVDIENDNYAIIGTLESYTKIRQYYGEHIVIPIYVEVEDGERLSRALSRERLQKNPKYKELCRRFIADCDDFSSDKIKSVQINKIYQNDDLEICYNQIKEDINAYK